MSTLGTLIHHLGAVLLEVDAAPRGLDESVGDVVLHDPQERDSVRPHDLVLGVGVSSAHAAALLVGPLARARATGVVVKAAERSDELCRTAEVAGLAVLRVPPGAAWTHVLVALRQALAQSGGGEDRSLGDPAAGDLFTVANLLAGVVDGPVVFEDAQTRVIAYSDRQEEADAARAASVLGRRTPEPVLREMRENGVFRRVAGERGPVYLEVIATGVTPRLGIAVRADDEVVGYIWAAVHRPPTAEHRRAITDAAGLVALHLLRHRLGADVHRALQSELVGGVLAGGSRATAAAQRLGLPTSGCRLTGVALRDARGGGDVRAGRCAELLSLHLRPLYRDVAIGLIDGTVYALVPTRSSARAATALRSAADAFIDRCRQTSTGEVVVAISDDFTRPGEAAAARAEVDEGLRVARTRAVVAGAIEVHEVRLESLMLRLVDACGRDPFIERAPVARLADHDARHGTAYLRTLAAFLGALGDVERAAATLNVHGNTVRYRLRQLQDLVAIDLRRPDHFVTCSLLVRVPRAVEQAG